jgi:hypothetical protein
MEHPQDVQCPESSASIAITRISPHRHLHVARRVSTATIVQWWMRWPAAMGLEVADIGLALALAAL